MLAKKKQTVLFIRNTETASDKERKKILQLETSHARKAKKISAKGHIKPPKHDFL